MSFLHINNIRKHFGETTVLKGIDIAIEQGDFLVLVGPSGCGKSTLLNMIAGLDSISDGELLLNGRRINEVHPAQRDIAMVFQSYALYPSMTVAGNIGFGLEMRKVPKHERREAIERVAKMLQIENLLDRKPGQLSGGQRQRVAMGRALVREPQLFLFDEPLSNLDAKLRVDMRTEIKQLHQRLGATIVYVTHDQIEAMTLATRIAVMRAGELQQLGTPQQVYDDPGNLFVAGFMGSPSMNLLNARIVMVDDEPVARIAAGEGTLELPIVRDREALRGWQDREVIIGLRPEAITDPASANRQDGVIHETSLTVSLVEPTGADVYAVTHLGGRDINARMRPGTQLSPGEQTRFAFDVSRMVAFDPQSEERIR
ncbi:carbohydrate ABC transporter ATP-binding protein (CUT1 family) [Kushneria sinocarnis]|uniref:Carbohydrate ABC transporter ATP-binding protein (CUT1 family) n=1 Tax=Kushneria sinocarnis TaxID=595502 RepID=A0A420X1D3_9GAMM|nr:ABC transporter ATP-binding protein [Kushneria sinocarnis]RKR07485.1 carbohydrate ABC transporter ATP-binding protein (CUT1 family) [Kushneria sinocarnis]